MVHGGKGTEKKQYGSGRKGGHKKQNGSRRKGALSAVTSSQVGSNECFGFTSVSTCIRIQHFWSLRIRIPIFDEKTEINLQLKIE